MDDDRFRYCPREHNLGILANVVEGYKASTTPYVMEVDDDDCLTPTCLEHLIAPLEREADVVLSFADLEVVDAEGTVGSAELRASAVQKDRVLHEGRYDDFTLIAARGFVFTIAALFRRDAIDWSEIPEEAATSYDRYLALAAARTGGAAFYVDERVVRYRVHDRSDTAQQYMTQHQGAMFILEHARDGAGPEERAILDAEITNLRVEGAKFLLREGQRRAAAASAVAALTSPGMLGYLRHRLDRRATRSSLD